MKNRSHVYVYEPLLHFLSCAKKLQDKNEEFSYLTENKFQKKLNIALEIHTIDKQRVKTSAGVGKSIQKLSIGGGALCGTQ